MTNVVNLFPAKEDPHLTGTAICTACRHEWQTVAPVGVVELECPSCGSMRGLLKHPCGAGEGDRLWRCNCGSELFYIVNDEVRCRECGLAQRWMPGQ